MLSTGKRTSLLRRSNIYGKKSFITSAPEIVRAEETPKHHHDAAAVRKDAGEGNEGEGRAGGEEARRRERGGGRRTGGGRTGSDVTARVRQSGSEGSGS